MNVPFKVGSILANKYRVDRVLGSGGMGYVLAATHVRLNERVALKLLHPNVRNEAGLSARFLQEARSAAKIRSEHIVRVRDVDALEDGSPYLVMEYLEGRDLEGLVRLHGPLPIPIAAEYMMQVCVALAEAHWAGVVHRDMKPANIFLTQRSDGTPLIKVLDFGISKVIAGEDGSVDLTRTAEIRGSPLFMSPEQMRRPREVDGRSDLWSVGVTLFYLLTGTCPFLSENALELCLTILQDEPVPLRRKRPDAPHALEHVIGRCLQKNPADRYANAGELSMALSVFAAPEAQAFADRAVRISSGGGVTARGRLPSVADSAPDSRVSMMPGAATPAGGVETSMDGRARARLEAAQEENQTTLLYRKRDVPRWVFGVGVGVAATVVLGIVLGVRRAPEEEAPVVGAGPVESVGREVDAGMVDARVVDADAPDARVIVVEPAKVEGGVDGGTDAGVKKEIRPVRDRTRLQFGGHKR